MVGGGATATSVTTRATASTAASKAKAIATGDGKETGIKRKRDALVEVTGLVTNNNNVKAPAKEGTSTIAKAKETSLAKPKTTIKPPSKRTVGVAAPKRTVARAGSENRTVPKAQADVARVRVRVPTIPESMEVDEAKHLSKRRHKVEVDDSEVEADVIASQLAAVEPSVQLETAAPDWDDLDADDWDDPFMVSEYVAEVCLYLKEIEVSSTNQINKYYVMINVA